MKIGIIGNGFVGQATMLLQNPEVNILVYDIDPNKCIPKNISLENLSVCDIIFIAVPTPMNPDGSCHLNIVESVIENLKVKCPNSCVVVRSTVPVGTSDKLQVNFMPEFLTEKNWRNDFYNCDKWVFGLSNENNIELKQKISKLFALAKKYNKIKCDDHVFVTNKEAEMIKYFKNTFLAVKVSYCNELEEFCRKKNINYETVRQIATEDERIGKSHTTVPGHDGHRGFSGTCFPKDTNSLLYEMNKAGMKSYILESTIKRNQEVDRTNNDWNENKGRCVV